VDIQIKNCNCACLDFLQQVNAPQIY
jgi:hypothetical protein